MTAKQRTKASSRPTSQPRQDRIEEARHYRWLLTQRLLADVDELRLDRRAYLDWLIPNWNDPLTEEDIEHAVCVIDTDLNDAFTTWFNIKGLHPTPLTFEEIIRRAETEG